MERKYLFQLEDLKMKKLSFVQIGIKLFIANLTLIKNFKEIKESNKLLKKQSNNNSPNYPNENCQSH